MESQGSPVIHEMAQAVLQEMEFYKELKKRRFMMSAWRPPDVGMNEQQTLAYEQSSCDPLLKEMAKTIIEEAEYNRNHRKMAMCLLYSVLIIILVVSLIVAGLVIWAFTKPSTKRKY